MKLSNRLILFLLGLGLLASCTGYKFVERNNPLRNYGIDSISIPMFVNKSVVPGINAYLTEAFFSEFAAYSGLKIYSGEKQGVDGVLVGIILGPEQYKAAYLHGSRRFIPGDGPLKTSIGNRPAMYTHATTTYNLVVRLVLIKDPYQLSKDFLEKTPDSVVKAHPNIIFDEILPLTGSFTRSLFDNVNPDAGGNVNFTNSRKVMDKSLKDVAKSTAKQFKEVLLNAF